MNSDDITRRDFDRKVDAGRAAWGRLVELYTAGLAEAPRADA